jgi:hypothetical protein
MTAHDLRASLRGHKVRLFLDGGDTVVRIWAPVPVAEMPAGLLAEARTRKGELLDLLRSEAAAGPPGVRLYFADESGRPCAAEDATMWCWEGGPRWFHTSDRPVPAEAPSSRPQTRKKVMT